VQIQTSWQSCQSHSVHSHYISQVIPASIVGIQGLSNTKIFPTLQEFDLYFTRFYLIHSIRIK
jgi:hypothetical protein